MNKRSWKNQYRIEKEFEKAIYKCKSYFMKLLKLANTDVNRFSYLLGQFQSTEAWEKFVQFQVDRMVTPLAVQNERTWREAARKSTRGNMIYRLLKAEFRKNLEYRVQQLKEENAALIRTLPSDVAKKVVDDIAVMVLEGKRSSYIEHEIKKYTDQHLKASARLIARTEVSKTQAALTQARAEQLEIRWYVWRTEEDERVRDSHRNMNDVLVAWSNPPSPEALIGEKSVGSYHAGCIWNCRCYAEPLVELEDIDWPHNVYYNSVIQRMTLEKFKEIM